MFSGFPFLFVFSSSLHLSSFLSMFKHMLEHFLSIPKFAPSIISLNFYATLPYLKCNWHSARAISVPPAWPAAAPPWGVALIAGVFLGKAGLTAQVDGLPLHASLCIDACLCPLLEQTPPCHRQNEVKSLKGSSSNAAAKSSSGEAVTLSNINIICLGFRNTEMSTVSSKLG